MAFAMPSLADNVKIGGINYRISGSTATVMPNNYDDSSGSVIVIGLNNGYEGDVVIPETITVDGVSYEVTSAFEGTFSNSTKLTSVSLPSTLTDLGSTPFSSCNKLLSINVSPDNPTYSSVDGVLYNKSKSTLISCPGGKTAHFEVPSGVMAAHPGAFLIHGHGPCMNRRYPEDAYLLVDPRMEPRTGDAVLVQDDDGRGLVRVYARGTSSLMLSPDSWSEAIEDIVGSPDDPPVRVVGVVVWYQAARDVRRG